MRSRFDEQLALLNRELIEMGALCEEVIALSAQALTEGNAELAARVAPLDQEIDRKEREIESLCLKLLLQRTHGVKNKAKLDEIVEKSLRGAAIWDEVKDRLKKNALGLSGGQQQRLCIARALAVEPEVLLMDEPTSALDPISTSKIEELAMELKEKYTIVIVTHNMQQAVRISDHTAFFLLGELVEYGETEKLFSQPQDKRTEDYITGRFG